MKLYHATPEANLDSIMDNGLLPSFDGVYMTEDIKAAQWFASLQEQMGSTDIVGGKLINKNNPHSVILEIDYDDLEKEKMGRNHEMLCDMLKTPDFYCYYGVVAPKSITQILAEL